MSERSAPDFAALLGPFIGSVPDAGRPGFLALLERGAAARYREWAAVAPDDAEGLIACAAREEQIAERVERLFPVDAELEYALKQALPGAREAYYEVFTGLPLRDQLALQASAERQGAAAWRGMASGHPDAATREALESCAQLEEANATYLETRVG